MAWISETRKDNPKIQLLAKALKEAAGRVRDCPDCDKGFQSRFAEPYPYYKECQCHKAWRGVYKDLRIACLESGEDWAKYVTRDMLNLGDL